MSFDIEKMKIDGVSSHLIEFASLDQETLLLLISRRLEHDKLFQQFFNAEVGTIESMYPYAVAAGLISEEDRKWLIDEENPYKSQTYRITFNNAHVWDIIDFNYIEVNIGESITLPASSSTYWYIVDDNTSSSNSVGYGGQSYTPTANITLYGYTQQEI